jgi:hypothetical protein
MDTVSNVIHLLKQNKMVIVVMILIQHVINGIMENVVNALLDTISIKIEFVLKSDQIVKLTIVKVNVQAATQIIYLLMEDANL